MLDSEEQLKAKRKIEEPCTVVLYAGFCEGVCGVIRYPISITAKQRKREIAENRALIVAKKAKNILNAENKLYICRKLCEE